MPAVPPAPGLIAVARVAPSQIHDLFDRRVMSVSTLQRDREWRNDRTPRAFHHGNRGVRRQIESPRGTPWLGRCSEARAEVRSLRVKRADGHVSLMPSLSALCYASLRATGCIALARLIHRGGVVLCYHNVVAERGARPLGDPGLHLPAGRFREQMEWLTANYDVVPLGDFMDRAASRDRLRRVATVTFDDAYAGVFANALPVLHRLGLPATVFVVSEAAEHRRPFWWDQPAVQRLANPARRRRWLGALHGDHDAILKDLGIEDQGGLPPEYLPASWETLAAAARAGVALGVHSRTHRSLPRLPDAELQGELVASRAAIELRTGTEPVFFAYPYGLWGGRVRQAVRAAGYRAACTLDYGLVDPATDHWALPRANIPATIRSAAFEAWSGGLSLRWLDRR